MRQLVVAFDASLHINRIKRTGRRQALACHEGSGQISVIFRSMAEPEPPRVPQKDAEGVPIQVTHVPASSLPSLAEFAPSKTEDDDILILCDLEDHFNEEVDRHAQRKFAEKPVIETRTELYEDAFDEKGFYVPLVSKTEEERVASVYGATIEAKKPLEEHEPMSAKANEQLNLLLHFIVDTSSRLAVSYKRGALKSDLKNYTHTHHLTQESPYQLFSQLRDMRRGDVWRFCTFGDVLYHTPHAERNVFSDPTIRRKTVEEEAAAKVALLEEINAQQKRRGTIPIRVAALEDCISKMSRVFMALEEQRNSIQILIAMHTRENFHSDLMNVLRDTVGRLDARVRVMDKLVVDMLRAKLAPPDSVDAVQK